MWHRIFTATSNEPDPAALLQKLQQESLDVQAHFRGDDLGWTGCALHLGSSTPIYLDRFLTSEDDLRDDLNSWAAWVESQDYEPKRFALMERIIQTQQLFVLRKPLDHADEIILDRLCQIVTNHLAHEVQGFYQIDGQGFFEADGTLILKEY